MCKFLITFFMMLTFIAASQQTQFVQVTNRNLTVLPLVSYFTRTLLDCCRQCLVVKQQCQSFLYNDGSKNCTLGSVLVPTLPANTSPSPVVYKMVQPCDLASGFKVITLDKTSVCVWISPVAVNFTSARDTCRAKHSYLYSPKSIGQLNILVNVSAFQGQLVWLGLTDIVQDNVFVWEDDGYVLPYNERKALFNGGEPSGGVTENCVVLVRPPARGAADVKCSDETLFMCDVGDFLQ